MNKNIVELISWHNGDRGIARAAWTSTQRDVDKKTDEQTRNTVRFSIPSRLQRIRYQQMKVEIRR